MERNIFFTDYMMAGWYQCFGAAAGALQELSKAKRKKNEKKIIVAITLQFWT